METSVIRYTSTTPAPQTAIAAIRRIALASHVPASDDTEGK